MSETPNLETERLLLRPIEIADAPRVRELAGDRDIAATTATVPHPYEEGMAKAWISSLQASDGVPCTTFAITLKPERALVGVIGLTLEEHQNAAELGYWVGKPHWNQGICTEAAAEIVRYGFSTLKLHRIEARHMLKNPSSGRVMEKIGMTHRENLARNIERFGTWEDVAVYEVKRT